LNLCTCLIECCSSLEILAAEDILRYVQSYQDGIERFQGSYGRVPLQNRFNVVCLDHAHLMGQTLDLLTVKPTPVAKHYRRKGGF